MMHRSHAPEPAAAEPGFLTTLIGDGRPLLSLTGLALILSGAFALFLSATGSFLPHDVDFLGMTARDLCAVNQCRIVHFMFHDRVAFGGVLIATGTLYLWLAAFPLRAGEAWAWWTFAVSGTAGFASFLCYLGYGYLDTWHGSATLVLLPMFALGMALSRKCVAPASGSGESGASWADGVRSLFAGTGQPLDFRSRAGLGRAMLMLTAIGQLGAGAVIMSVGMTLVFVPQDLAFIGMNPEELGKVNPRLIPLIAHDRAGFGGGLVCYGLLHLSILWNARISRHLWQALLVSGITGFASAILVHFAVGYTDFIHLAPAYTGAVVYVVAMYLTYPASYSQTGPP